MPSYVNPQQSDLLKNIQIGPKFGPQILQKPPVSNSNLSLSRPNNLPDIEQGESGLPRIVNYNADQGGCGLWRVIWPSDYLLAYKKATVMNMYQLVLEPYFYETIDAVKFQRQCKDNQIKLIQHMRAISNAKKSKNGKNMKILWEVDDLVAPANCIPDFNKSKGPFNNEEIMKNLFKLNDLVDEFVVVSDYMKRHYQHYAGWKNVTVVPNYLPFTWLRNHYSFADKMKQMDDNKKKPRIGYMGSASHFDVKNNAGQKDDFDHVIDMVHKTKDKYQWVFVGGHPLRLYPLVKSGEIEFHPWVPIMELHEKVNSLNLQATIAPIMDHPFNRAKSDIKLMESAALGLPCICQDLEPYENALFKFNTGQEMIDQIDAALADYDASVINSYNLTNNRWLHEHLDEHVLTYMTEYGSEERKKNEWLVKNNTDQFS